MIIIKIVNDNILLNEKEIKDLKKTLKVGIYKQLGKKKLLSNMQIEIILKENKYFNI